MASIQIKWLGHSCFRVECQGYAIVVDPFEPGSVPGCKDIAEVADQVLCSHGHHDHNYREGVTLRESRGESPFQVTELPSFHDDCQGTKRGPNTIHLLEAEGMRVAHFGDVGEMPQPQVLEQLQNVDVALLPVGGFYTVGPKEAKAIVDAIQPKVVIPMHYRSESFGFDVLGTVEDFLRLCGSWERRDSNVFEAVPGMPSRTVVLSYPG